MQPDMDELAVTTRHATIACMNTRPRRNVIIHPSLAAGVVLVLTGALAAALAGFGHRWGWWAFTTGFVVLRWAVTQRSPGSLSPRSPWSAPLWRSGAGWP